MSICPRCRGPVASRKAGKRATTRGSIMGRALGATLMISLVAAGCSAGGPEIVPIEGTVTHQGEPVLNLLIYFVSTEGRPSWGLSDANGHFVLDYDAQHKGAKVGTHKIWVVD